MDIAGRLREQRWDWCAEAGALLPALSPPLACHSVLLDLVSAQGEAKGPRQAPSFGFLPGPLGGQTLACLSLHRTRGNCILGAQPSTGSPDQLAVGWHMQCVQGLHHSLGTPEFKFALFFILRRLFQHELNSGGCRPCSPGAHCSLPHDTGLGLG